MFVKKSTILLGFLFACILSGTVADERVVNTTNGQVRGLSDRTQRINVDYYSFRGIPYAKPPTGDLRFKVRIFLMNRLSVEAYVEFFWEY